MEELCLPGEVISWVKPSISVYIGAKNNVDPYMRVLQKVPGKKIEWYDKFILRQIFLEIHA